MMDIIRFWSSLPLSSIWMVTPNRLETLLFYALIFFIFYFKGRTWARIGTLVTLLFVMADVGYWISQVKFNDKLKVTFIDVGQANAALVEFPMGEKMMIDGGGFPRDRFDVGKMVVAPFLWYSKILSIDYIVLSHPQSDHMNGLRFIAEAFNPKEFWYNGDHVETASFKELMTIIEDRKIRKQLPTQLMSGRQINGAAVEVLHPMTGEDRLRAIEGSKALNNNSLVLKISYAGGSLLFPGDLENDGEAVLISNAGERLKSHVLLSPHHGAKNSSSVAFLDKVQPRICVISSGEGNFFGFPHPKTLERLRAINCNVIRIDQAGATRFVVGQEQLRVTTFIDADASITPP
jgi:competence protein ComEC